MSIRLSCFVIMPYSADSDRVYTKAIVPVLRAIPNREILVLRADRMGRETITLHAHVESAVRSADFIIADISGSNPNVMYELGYAVATGKTVIIITREDQQELPSNIRDSYILQYLDDRLQELKPRLLNLVEKTISQLEIKPTVADHIKPERELSISLRTNTLIDEFTGSIRKQLFALAGSPSFVSDIILPKLIRQPQSGLVVRIVTANPEGEFARMRSIDTGLPVAQYRVEMWEKINLLQQQLKQMKGIHTELRITDKIVYNSVYLADDIAIMLPYLSAGRSRESALVTISLKLNPKLYAIFREQFDQAWFQATSDTLKFERPKEPKGRLHGK